MKMNNHDKILPLNSDYTTKSHVYVIASGAKQSRKNRQLVVTGLPRRINGSAGAFYTPRNDKYKASTVKILAAVLAFALLIGQAALGAFAASDAAGSGAASNGGIKYPETRGIVNLTLSLMNSRIKYDNDDYQVSQKRADIYQRRLASAMHDKYLAENKDAPQQVFSAQRVAYEKQRHTDWRNSELDYERYQNDLKEKFNSIKSKLRKQYTDILDIEKSLRTYQDEMEILNANIAKLTAQINVGVAKAADMDMYDAQKLKLEADVAAKTRDLQLAKYNLKADLKIDQFKDITLSENDEKFIRYDDSRIEKTIGTAADGCFSVASNKKKLQILKDERAIMLQWDREGAMLSNLQNNEVSIKETEYSIINSRNTQEASLWSDYYALLNQEDQIEIEKLNVKIAETDYSLVDAKLKQGLLTPLDEQNSRIAVQNAKSALQTAINNYMRMSEDFAIRLAN